jgi:hypothetical protein
MQAIPGHPERDAVRRWTQRSSFQWPRGRLELAATLRLACARAYNSMEAMCRHIGLQQQQRSTGVAKQCAFNA